MAKPVTLNDALGLIRRSRLLDDDTLGRFAARNCGDGVSPVALLERFVVEGLLTPFQARQIAGGRWRGMMLQNYRLLARLGTGGMGQVYLGEHVALGRRVAVKVLAADLVGNPLALARLVREARAAAALDHPNIVRVFDIDTDTDPPFLVMEYVDGVSLQAAVAVAGTFAAEAVAVCGRQIAVGLQHAWENGLVHRDVKPANLLLDRRGEVRILDLGIVRVETDQGLTVQGGSAKQILGTLDYLAPEQAIDSSAVDCRADVYGLGSTLYFLLAGHPPFRDGPPTVRLIRKQTTDPPPIHALRPDVPPGLSAAIARMMARKPADRYPTPADAADALYPFAVPTASFPDELFTALDGGWATPRAFEGGECLGADTAPVGGSVRPFSPSQSVLSDTVLGPQPETNVVPVAETAPATPLPTPVDTPMPGRIRRPVPRRPPCRPAVWNNPLLWLSLAAAIASAVLLAVVWSFVFR